MSRVAVAIVCKTPGAGASKTRLSGVLSPDECADLSACFLRDLGDSVAALADECGAAAYAAYAPLGTERRLRALLPRSFELIPRADAAFGAVLFGSARALLEAGHAGVVLVNSDSPTLPRAILRQAVDATRAGDVVVLGRALDGGYTLIGLSRPHGRLFEDVPWSTEAVYAVTRERAAEAGLAVVDVPAWYDVDDAASFGWLAGEVLRGVRPAGCGDLEGAVAPATRRFLLERSERLATAPGAAAAGRQRSS